MIKRLKQIGFSDNEAKVFLELLKGYPATAYQIAKRTGLAGANVYQVLATLVQKGLVIATEGEKKLYNPLDPSSWLTDMKKSFKTNIDLITKELTSLYGSQKEDSLIYRLKNKDAIFRKVDELIAAAKYEIYFDFFPSHFDNWQTKLINVAKKGILIKGIVYQPFKNSFENFYISTHPWAEIVMKQHENEIFTLLIDAKQVIFGSFSKDGDLISSYWSQNPELCLMLESGMRSEMVWWFLEQNIDIKANLSESQKKSLAILQNTTVFKDREKYNGF